MSYCKRSFRTQIDKKENILILITIHSFATHTFCLGVGGVTRYKFSLKTAEEGAKNHFPIQIS